MTSKKKVETNNCSSFLDIDLKKGKGNKLLTANYHISDLHKTLGCST